MSLKELRKEGQRVGLRMTHRHCFANTALEHVLRVERTGIQFRILVNDSFALQNFIDFSTRLVQNI